MRRQNVEANKAIAEAWEREQQRVKEGKGTRDWTPEQQKQILEKGKAYDEDGKAFEGQHMKSAEAHPEYQGDPNNIQFLTRKEHFEAHGGNWQNPTNGYYDPATKEMTDFGEGEPVPCKVIELSNPVVEVKISSSLSENSPKEEAEKADRTRDGPKHESSSSAKPGSGATNHKASQNTASQKIQKSAEDGILKTIVKGALSYAKEHPLETAVKALEVVSSGLAFASDVSRNKARANASSQRKRTANTSSSAVRSKPAAPKTSIKETPKVDIPKVDVSTTKTTRKSPDAHTVKPHGQRYGKDKVWKEKKSYPRGGKKDT